MSKIEQVGFIGLDLMGTSMSNNLLKAGFKVKGYDPLPGAGDGIKPNGGEVVPTPGETGDGAQLVIVMVPAGQGQRQAHRQGQRQGRRRGQGR